MQGQVLPTHLSPTQADNQLPLYVGNLPPNVDEKKITSFFKSYAMDVSKVEMGKPRGGYIHYCFIYTTPECASRILDQVNYKVMEENEISIMRYNTYPNRSRPELNIFVRGLPENTSSKDLHDVIANLDPKATIESVKVGRDENGKKLRYGYVNFSKQCEDAVKKIIAKKTFTMNGTVVDICEFTKKKLECSNVYLKEFPKEWTTQQHILNWITQNNGKTTNYYFPKKENSDELKGFGMADLGADGLLKFVSKACNVSEEQVRTKFQSEEPSFKTKEGVYVGKALSRRERENQLERKRKAYRKELKERTRNKNVYVNSFPEDYDDAKLKKTFEIYGTITSAKVMMDETKTKSRCFGFVCFDTVEAAKTAIEKGKELQIGGKRLTVNLAQSKQNRKNLFEKQKYSQYQFPPHYMPMPQPQFVQQYGMTSQPRQMIRGVPSPYIPMQPRPHFPPQYPYVVPSLTIPVPQQQHQPPLPQQQPIPNRQKIDKPSVSVQLAGKIPEEQKEMLGDMIFTLASKEDEESAPKITGMLLELEISELIYNMDFDNMKSKIDEARQVMRENQPH